MLTFRQEFPPKGRIVCYLSEIQAGVIFPGDRYRWRLLLDQFAAEHEARTELAAKSALNAAVNDWLRRAGLMRA